MEAPDVGPTDPAAPPDALGRADDRRSGTERTSVAVMAAVLVLAVLLLAAGLLVAVARGFPPDVDDTRPAAVLSGLPSAEPAALLATGIVLLLSTPMVRLAVLAVAFARRREWLFALLTALVLAELGVSAVVAARR